MKAPVHYYSATVLVLLCAPSILWFSSEGYLKEEGVRVEESVAFQLVSRVHAAAERVLQRAEQKLWRAERRHAQHSPHHPTHSAREIECNFFTDAQDSLGSIQSVERIILRNNAPDPTTVGHASRCEKRERGLNLSLVSQPGGRPLSFLPRWAQYASNRSVSSVVWYSNLEVIMIEQTQLTLVQYDPRSLFTAGLLLEVVPQTRSVYSPEALLPQNTALFRLPTAVSTALGVHTDELHSRTADNREQERYLCNGYCPVIFDLRRAIVQGDGYTTVFQVSLYKHLPIGVTASVKSDTPFITPLNTTLIVLLCTVVTIALYCLPLYQISNALFEIGDHAADLVIDEKIGPQNLFRSTRSRFTAVAELQDTYCKVVSHVLSIVSFVPEAALHSSTLISEGNENVVRASMSLSLTKRGSLLQMKNQTETQETSPPLQQNSEISSDDSIEIKGDIILNPTTHSILSGKGGGDKKKKTVQMAPDTKYHPHNRISRGESELEVADSLVMLQNENDYEDDNIDMTHYEDQVMDVTQDNVEPVAEVPFLPPLRSYVSMYKEGDLHRLEDAPSLSTNTATHPTQPVLSAPTSPALPILPQQIQSEENEQDGSGHTQGMGKKTNSRNMGNMGKPPELTRKLSESLGIADLMESPQGGTNRGGRSRGFSQSAFGVRPKRATVMICELEVFMSNTNLVEEHVELSNTMLDTVLFHLKQNDGVPVIVTANQIIAGWNTHAVQKDHVHPAASALYAVRNALAETVENQASWACVLASGNTFSGFSGVIDQRLPVVGGETLSIAHDMLNIAPKICARALVNEGVFEKVKTRFEMRIVEVIALPVDPGGEEADAGEERKPHCIYELIEPSMHAVYGSSLYHYNEGFAAFREHDFAASVARYRDFLCCHPSDYQAFRNLKNAQLFLENPQLAPPKPFTRVNLGWQNLEEASMGQEFLYFNSFDPPLEFAKEEGAKVSNKITALQRRVVEDKTKEGNRLKRDILKAAEHGEVQEGDATFYMDRKGVKWSRSGIKLGEGAFGEVYKGMSEQGSLVAMKILKLPKQKQAVAGRYAHRRRAAAAKAAGGGGPSIEQATEELVNEVNLLTTLRHENVVAYLASIVSGNFIIICMEYMSGGSLGMLLELYLRLPLSAVTRYLIDILRGLKFLHDSNIVHRDVKPDNVLLHIDGTAKLSDFGTSQQQMAQIAGKMSVQGTPLYMAPEAARGFGVFASDIWALGITAVQIVTGSVPWVFTEENPYMTHNFIYRLGNDPTFRPQVAEDLPKQLREFIDTCLVEDPQMRLPASELLVSPLFCGNLPHKRSKYSMLERTSRASASQQEENLSRSPSHSHSHSHQSHCSGSMVSYTSSVSNGETTVLRQDVTRKENHELDAALSSTQEKSSHAIHGHVMVPGVGIVGACVGWTMSNSRKLTQLLAEEFADVKEFDSPLSAEAHTKGMFNTALASNDTTEVPPQMAFVLFTSASKVLCCYAGNMQVVLCRYGKSFPLAIPTAEQQGIQATQCDLVRGDLFVVMASLFVWNKLGEEHIVHSVHSGLDKLQKPNQLAQLILEQCGACSEPLSVSIVMLKVSPSDSASSGTAYSSYPPLLEKWKQMARQENTQSYTYKKFPV